MSKQFEHMQKLAFGKVITKSENSQFLNESTLKDKIKELVHSTLGEAKKKKKDKPEDVAPQDDTVDIDMDMDLGAEEASDDVLTPSSTDEIDIDPKVKTIQDSLSKALANAKALGDEKLVNQIGNTITMLVRTQVVGQQVAESDKQYYKDAEADDAEHIKALEKDMKDDKKLSENQNSVIKYYLSLFQEIERNNTDDIEDLKNMVTATDLFRQNLLDSIKELELINEISSSSSKIYSDDEVSNDILNKGIGNKDRGVVFFEAWHLGMHSGLEDEEAWNIYTNRNVNID